MRRLIFLIIINALCLGSLHAAKIYKRAPFDTKISTDDIIIAEYDLSESRGLYCKANNKPFQVSFTYKGRDKTATLPIMLQNYRVPVNNEEELADTSGTITLMNEAENSSKSTKISISCQYSN